MIFLSHHWSLPICLQVMYTVDSSNAVCTTGLELFTSELILGIPSLPKSSYVRHPQCNQRQQAVAFYSWQAVPAVGLDLSPLLPWNLELSSERPHLHRCLCHKAPWPGGLRKFSVQTEGGESTTQVLSLIASVSSAEIPLESHSLIFVPWDTVGSLGYTCCFQLSLATEAT